MSGRNYSARVMRFRRGVYGARIGKPDHAPDCPEPAAARKAEQARAEAEARGEKPPRHRSVCRTRGCGSITVGCQVFLLRLSDDMNAGGKVSVPRSQLAAELGCSLARITEWVAMAERFGFLSRVRRGRPGVTAVYEGLFVAPEVRDRVPTHEVREPGHYLVRDRVPHSDPQRYATGGSQEVVPAAGIETAPSGRPSRRGSNEDQADEHHPPPPSSGCRAHPWFDCPPDCRNAPTEQRGTA